MPAVRRLAIFLKPCRRWAVVAPILMTLALGFLIGDDCDVDFHGLPGIHVVGWDPYPYDTVVVEEPVYYDPFWW